jgi:hypothetical protein
MRVAVERRRGECADDRVALNTPHSKDVEVRPRMIAILAIITLYTCVSGKPVPSPIHLDCKRRQALPLCSASNDPKISAGMIRHHPTLHYSPHWIHRRYIEAVPAKVVS